MNESEILAACEEVLQHLEAISFVAQRDARKALPCLDKFRANTRLYWLEAARDLFLHDREAGKAFMRRTPEITSLWEDVSTWTDQALVFRNWVNSWHALDGFLEQAGHVYKNLGIEAERRWFEIGLRWCARAIEDGRAFFETDYVQLSGKGGITDIEDLIAPAEQLHQSSGLSLKVYLPGALMAREVVGVSGLDPWARRGADLMRSGRLRGEAYFRLASEEGLRYLLDELPGYRLRQHGRFLQMLLLAWFDELIPLGDSDWRPGKGTPMILCDGRSLLMPPILPDREEAIVAALHTAGHLRYDTYARSEIDTLFRARGMSHPSVDEDQRMTWRPLFAEFGDRLFRFQVLFDLCEDIRIDSQLGILIPDYFTRLARVLRRAETPEGPAGYYYEYACRQLGALVEGEVLDARLVPLIKPEAKLVDAYQTALGLFEDNAFPELTASQRDMAYPPGHGINTGPAVYPRPQYEVLHDALHADAYAERRPSRERQQELPQQTPGQQQKDPDADINEPRENTSGSGGRIGAGKPMPSNEVHSRRATRDTPSGGFPYPEWDYREQRYIDGWARIHEIRWTETASKRANRILEEYAGVLKRMRKSLEMQRPTRPAPRRHQPDGDELDMDATVAYVTEKRAGLSPDGLIYRRRAAQQRDIAVMLLADLSTSIMARHVSGDGKLIDRVRSGLILFSEAIASLGDPYAICGFASKHHDNVNYFLIKDFNEAGSSSLNARLAAVSGRLASRMGAAIRHSILRFEAVEAHHRLLLLLTDGRPADYDDGGDPRYLKDDTRMAMKEARAKGITPFCITLDPRGGEYLPSIFGPNNFVLIDQVDELPARLPEIYLRLRR